MKKNDRSTEIPASGRRPGTCTGEGGFDVSDVRRPGSVPNGIAPIDRRELPTPPMGVRPPGVPRRDAAWLLDWVRAFDADDLAMLHATLHRSHGRFDVMMSSGTARTVVFVAAATEPRCPLCR